VGNALEGEEVGVSTAELHGGRRLAVGQELAVNLDLGAGARRAEPRLPEARALLAKKPRLER
jgi:hypothetical protein